MAQRLLDSQISRIRSSNWSLEAEAEKARRLNAKNNKKAAKSAADDALGIERAPREHGFHLLRHSVAALGYELTGDSVAVQKALGHADDSTTKAHDIHISQKSASRVLEAVANRILSHGDALFIQESVAVN